MPMAEQEPEPEPVEVRFKKALERLSYLHDPSQLFERGRSSPYWGHMDQLDADRKAALGALHALSAEVARRTAGIDHWTGDGHEHRDDDPTVANTTAWWDELDRSRRSP
jgi:hypothetical protein